MTPNRLADCRVAIVGLGLMGGSMAMSLRNKCRSIVGVDLDPQARVFSIQNKIVDKVSDQAGEVIPNTDVVILATPVGAIIDLIVQLPTIHPGNPVILDLGSTKEVIVSMMNHLPVRFECVAGHPMCGKETSSIVNAEADIYQEANFFLTKTHLTTTRAQALVEELAREIGSTPYWIDSRLHDQWVAFSSHLPYLVANILAQSIPEQAMPFVGPGLKSTTRLSGSDVEMMMDIIQTNLEFIKDSMQHFYQNLDEAQRLLSGGELNQLREKLHCGRSRYKTLSGK